MKTRRAILRTGCTVALLILLAAWVLSAWFVFDLRAPDGPNVVVWHGQVGVGWSEGEPGIRIKPHDAALQWGYWHYRRHGISLRYLPLWWFAAGFAVALGTMEIARVRQRKGGDCPKCGYSLVGLTAGSACPECGKGAVASV